MFGLEKLFPKFKFNWHVFFTFRVSLLFYISLLAVLLLCNSLPIGRCCLRKGKLAISCTQAEERSYIPKRIKVPKWSLEEHHTQFCVNQKKHFDFPHIFFDRLGWIQSISGFYFLYHIYQVHREVCRDQWCQKISL